MGGGSRRNHQRLGISNIGQMRGQLDRVDKVRSSPSTTLDTEGQDSAKAVVEDLLGVGVGGVRGKTGVGDPFNTSVVLEVLGQSQGVID